MEKKVTTQLIALTDNEVADTFGGYAPPEGYCDDILNPPAIPEVPNPLNPKDVVCW